MQHVYDFYKPNFSSPFPIVDGHFSNVCYLTALARCYAGFVERFEKEHNEKLSVVGGGIDYLVFHSPYNKLAQKALAQTVYFVKYIFFRFFAIFWGLKTTIFFRKKRSF